METCAGWGTAQGEVTPISSSPEVSIPLSSFVPLLWIIGTMWKMSLFHVKGVALVDTPYSDLEVYYVPGTVLLSPLFPREGKGKLRAV